MQQLLLLYLDVYKRQVYFHTLYLKIEFENYFNCAIFLSNF